MAQRGLCTVWQASRKAGGGLLGLHSSAASHNMHRREESNMEARAPRGLTHAVHSKGVPGLLLAVKEACCPYTCIYELWQ